MTIPVERLLSLVGRFEVNSNSYLLSYPHLLNYFATPDQLTWENLVVGIHSVYGWMPRVLSINDQHKREVVLIANQVKRSSEFITCEQITILKGCINNSIVGVSKLLHFINPQCYAIWDSRIYRFLHDRKSYYQTNSVENYRSYLVGMRDAVNDSRSEAIRSRVSGTIDYSVSSMRAIELVMINSVRNG